MTQEVGTLGELNVKPGDVVECVAGHEWFTPGRQYTITPGGWVVDDKGNAWGACNTLLPGRPRFRVVSRASDGPKLLRDMTDAEIGALLRANMRGKIIQGIYSSDRVWRDFTSAPKWLPYAYYRIKPEPTRETVEIPIDRDGFVSDVLQDDSQGLIVVEVVDGKIDPDTLRWEENQ
jgi:hypothetical protein